MRGSDIDNRIDDLIAQQQQAPDLQTFAVALMAEWGGPLGLARAAREDYENSDSSNTRAQLLRMVVDVIKLATPKPGTNAASEELKDPKLLEAAVKRLMKNGS